jgi:hypothetical protein
MLAYSFATESWTNNSLLNSLPAQCFLYGQGVCIPASGSAGVNLFFLGGKWSSNNPIPIKASHFVAKLDEIVVHDIQSN